MKIDYIRVYEMPKEEEKQVEWDLKDEFI